MPVFWLLSSLAISFTVSGRTPCYKQHSPNLVNLKRKGTYWKLIHPVVYRIGRKLENQAQKSSRNVGLGAAKVEARSTAGNSVHEPCGIPFSWTRPQCLPQLYQHQEESSCSLNRCLTHSFEIPGSGLAKIWPAVWISACLSVSRE